MIMLAILLINYLNLIKVIYWHMKILQLNIGKMFKIPN